MVTEPIGDLMFEGDEVDAVETLALVEFRPTLVIGLGGTGHEVVVRLKARFLETFGPDIFKIVKLLVFDTAQETVHVTNALGADVTLTKDTELINIGHVPVSSLLSNLDINPTIKAWLPADQLSVSAIHAGAKMIRPLGRLAFFYHFNHDAKIRDRLLSVIRALGNIKLRGPVGESIVIAKSRGINVFIISSVCGGTGAGTFLDMAYLVRELIQFSGIPQEYCFVNGLLVLPQAFANVAKDDIMANAYAALRELEFFSGEGRFFARYPGDQEITVHTRPFNICYLVDAVNENGKLLSGLEELSPMIAESVFIQISSQVGQATKSVFDNVKSLSRSAPTQYGREAPTCFSSLGTSALVFPAQLIINTCAYQFGHQFITRGLLRAADEKAADEMAKRFIEGQKLPPKPLLVALAADARGTTIMVRLSATPLADVEDKELLRRLEQMLANYEAQKLNRDFRQAVEKNTERLKRSVSQAIVQETQRLVDDPQYGLHQALAFLERVSARFNALTNAFARERGEIIERQHRLKRGQPALNKALSDAITSFVIGRGRRIAKARDAYIRSKEAEFSADFDVQTRNAAMRLFTDLRTTVDQQVKEVSALIDKLEQVQERFQRSADALKRDRRLPLLSTDVTSSDDVNTYYQERRREVESELARFTSELGGLYAWSERRTGAIARDIFDFVRQPFTSIADEKIEQIVERKERQTSPARYLQDLRDDSVPFWNYTPARLGTAAEHLESIAVIGVENMSDSIFAEHIRRGETLTTTLDQYQITVLHTKHGLPLFALTQVDAWAKKYENHISRDLGPLHLFPHLPWLQDIEQGKQYFALGQTFDYITKKGVWYYCQRKDERLDDVQLGQGLDPAIERFLSDTALLKEVEEMVRERIRQIGNDQAAVIIYDYERRPRSSGPQAKTELELQLAAGRFREEMDYSESDVLAARAKLEQGSQTPP